MSVGLDVVAEIQTVEICTWAAAKLAPQVSVITAFWGNQVAGFRSSSEVAI